MSLKEFAVQNRIKLVSFPALDEVDDITAEAAVSKFFLKMQKKLGSFDLTVQAKEFNKDRLRKQHELHSRLIAPKIMLSATATEWNFLSALQESLKDLEKEFNKKARLY